MQRSPWYQEVAHVLTRAQRDLASANERIEQQYKRELAMRQDARVADLEAQQVRLC